MIKAREGRPDLVLLDVMLPGLSGFDVLKALRAEGLDTPVIMLTAKSAELDKVLGFEALGPVALLGWVLERGRRRAPARAASSGEPGASYSTR